MFGCLGYLVWFIDITTGTLANLGMIGLSGLLMMGEFDVVLMCLPLLIVGLIWGIITVPFAIAPRAYWALSPLNVMGNVVGGVIATMINFFLAPMIFLMCIYAI